MKTKQFKTWIDRVIEAMEKEQIELYGPDWRNRPMPKRKPVDPNTQAHLDFCEDMENIGEASGTPWGGSDRYDF